MGHLVLGVGVLPALPEITLCRFAKAVSSDRAEAPGLSQQWAGCHPASRAPRGMGPPVCGGEGRASVAMQKRLVGDLVGHTPSQAGPSLHPAAPTEKGRVDLGGPCQGWDGQPREEWALRVEQRAQALRGAPHRGAAGPAPEGVWAHLPGHPPALVPVAHGLGTLFPDLSTCILNVGTVSVFILPCFQPVGLSVLSPVTRPPSGPGL